MTNEDIKELGVISSKISACSDVMVISMLSNELCIEDKKNISVVIYALLERYKKRIADIAEKEIISKAVIKKKSLYLEKRQRQ